MTKLSVLCQFFLVLLCCFVAINAMPIPSTPRISNSKFYSLNNFYSLFKYAGEVHIVHWNLKYGSFVNATKHNDGLAVFGILIDLQDKDNIAFRHIEHFDGIRAASKKAAVPLKDLLPSNTASFFRYEGSLTDARCNEDVILTVFETPISISHNQWKNSGS